MRFLHHSAPAEPAPSETEFAVVIPALSPGRDLVPYCRALLAATPHPIYLVNDGSDPSYDPVFHRCTTLSPRIRLLTHGVNRGKGRALKTAFAELLARHPRLRGCVTCDSDGQHAPEDVRNCLEELAAHPDALVLGCRRFSGKDVPRKSRMGNRWMRVLFFLATGRNFHDTQTGLRGISASFMRELLDVPGERFEFETAMLLSLRGRPIRQPEIRTIYKDGNKGTHFRPWSDSCRITGVVWRHFVRNLGLFALVSLTSFLVDIGLFSLLYYVAFRSLSVGRLAVAVGLARAVSLVYNYLCNRHLVFRGAFRVPAFGRRSFVRYLALALCIALASYWLTALVSARFPAGDAHVAAVKAGVDLLLFLASYFVQRTLVF